MPWHWVGRTVCVVAILASAMMIGCGTASDPSKSVDNGNAAQATDATGLDPQLDGTWVVTKWMTHKGDFPGGQGRRFIFDGASLTRHNEDGSDETHSRLVPAGEGDHRGFAMHSELDFDDDGEPDMVFLRHALYRFVDGQLQISYGTVNAQVDLSDPVSSSPQESAMPAGWEPTPGNDVVILQRAKNN